MATAIKERYKMEFHMLYFCRGLYKEGIINPDELIDYWQRFAQKIEQIDQLTWKIWDITQVSQGDEGQKIYGLQEGWQSLEMVAKAPICYIRMAQYERGMGFLLI